MDSLRNRYGLDAELLFTDTDSLLCHEIATEDFYQDMYNYKEHFDFNDMHLKQFINLENKK